MARGFWPLLSLIWLVSIQGRSSSILDLGNILKVQTNRNPLDFVNYGNWCGLGGGGATIDEIDRCCQLHDFCYDKAAETTCLEQKPHLAHYRWKYYNGKIHCNRVDKGCGFTTCKCDGSFANCISKNIHTYNPRYKKSRKTLMDLFLKIHL